MKKGKGIMTITIAIACFFLISIVFMQFKIVNQTDITEIENMRESELRTELANWKNKYEEINLKYEESSQKMEEYKTKRESNQETTEILDEELEQINTLLGKTDVQGEGIEITVRENKSTEDIYQIDADNLLLIVNGLKLAGAEAISINDERIINMSDIVNINNSFIKVNGQRVLAPYVIKAIGDQSYMESSITGRGGIIDELKKIGHDISIEKVSRTKINKYNDEIKLKYTELGGN